MLRKKPVPSPPKIALPSLDLSKLNSESEKVETQPVVPLAGSKSARHLESSTTPRKKKESSESSASLRTKDKADSLHRSDSVLTPRSKARAESFRAGKTDFQYALNESEDSSRSSKHRESSFTLRGETSLSASIPRSKARSSLKLSAPPDLNATSSSRHKKSGSHSSITTNTDSESQKETESEQPKRKDSMTLDIQGPQTRINLGGGGRSSSISSSGVRDASDKPKEKEKENENEKEKEKEKEKDKEAARSTKLTLSLGTIRPRSSSISSREGDAASTPLRSKEKEKEKEKEAKQETVAHTPRRAMTTLALRRDDLEPATPRRKGGRLEVLRGAEEEVMTPRRLHEKEKKEKKEKKSKKEKKDKIALKPSVDDLFASSKHYITYFRTFFTDMSPPSLSYSDEFLLQACHRYEKWLHFKRKYYDKSLSLPTDVRLVYLVHLSQPYMYYKTCKRFFGRVIDLQEQALTASVEETERLWRQEHPAMPLEVPAPATPSQSFSNGVVPSFPTSAIKDTSSPQTQRKASGTVGSIQRKGSVIIHPNGEPQEVLFIAQAKHDFLGQSANELPLKKGDLVVVLQQNEDGWWGGECNGVQGFFPATYVDIQDPLEVAALLQQQP